MAPTVEPVPEDKPTLSMKDVERIDGAVREHDTAACQGSGRLVPQAAATLAASHRLAKARGRGMAQPARRGGLNASTPRFRAPRVIRRRSRAIQ